MNPVLFRAILALGIALFGLGIYAVINRVILRRAAKNFLGLEEYIPGSPAVLYFTMEGCVPCKTTQRPALDRLSEIIGEKIQIIWVDALERPDLAESWGVLSVPTTFIIDSDGQPRRVNHGVALAEKLLAQLEEVTGNSLTVHGSTNTTEAAAPIPGD
jgi:thiol-disulfide isomerase/thioredoxin